MLFNKIGEYVQTSFQLGGIRHNKDEICMTGSNIISRDDFLIRSRGKRITSGKISQDHLLIFPVEDSFFLVYGFSGPVSDMLMGTGDHIENCRLTGIWLSE